MTPETINCLDCGRQLLLPDGFLDQTVRCPSCAREFIPRRENGTIQLEDLGRALHTDVPAPLYRVVGMEPLPSSEPHHPARELSERHAARHRSKNAKRPGRRGRTWACVGLMVGGLVVAAIAFFFFDESKTPIDAAEWRRFAPPGARASVLLPGEPSSGPFPNQRLNGFRYVLQYDDSTSFVFSHADIPDPAAGAEAQGIALDRLVAEQRDLTTESRPGAIVSDTMIQIGPHRGREVRIDQRRLHATTIFRMYLVTGNNGSRIYLLAASGPRIQPGGTDVVRFFESFELEG